MASGLIIWINQRVHVATGKVGGQLHACHIECSGMGAICYL